MSNLSNTGISWLEQLPSNLSPNNEGVQIDRVWQYKIVKHKTGDGCSISEE